MSATTQHSQRQTKNPQSHQANQGRNLTVVFGKPINKLKRVKVLHIKLRKLHGNGPKGNITSGKQEGSLEERQRALVSGSKRPHLRKQKRNKHGGRQELQDWEEAGVLPGAS